MNIDEIIYRVKDIMTTDFIKVKLDETINEVSNKMIEAFRDEVLLVNDNDELIGIFTMNDLGKIKKKGISLDRPICDFAKKGIINIGEEYSARNARDLMIQNGIGRLPIVNKGKLVGIVTSKNIRDTFYLKIDELFSLQSNILDNLHEAVCICEADGTVKYWNKSAEKLYGVSAEDIMDNHIGRFFPNAMILQVLMTGKRIDNVFHEPAEGKLVTLSAVPIYNKEKLIAAVSTDRDITEAVNLTKQLEVEKKKVEFLESEYKKEISQKYNFSTIIGKNKKVIEAISVAQKVATTSTSVLITGKSGTGKEVFAKAIHKASGRNGNFVAINCSAIPENLIESELFGYVEGAFTGAIKKGKIGKFEFASGGTLFLDEIGDMPLDMQVKILRVLQDGVIFRLGGEKAINTDTRIIAATNRDLMQLIKENKFREDLFYRLAVVQMDLPPLCERKEDIKDLSNLFFNEVSTQEGIMINSIDDRIYSILSSYKWDGNIRELKNVVQRMVVLSNEGKITIDSIPEYITDSVYSPEKLVCNQYDLEAIVQGIERKTIKEVMSLVSGNKQQASKILNLKRSTLYYKLDKYGL